MNARYLFCMLLINIILLITIAHVNAESPSTQDSNIQLQSLQDYSLEHMSNAETTAEYLKENILDGCPTYSQESDPWCPWVSAQMVLEYYGYTIPAQRIAVKTYGLASQKWDVTKGLDMRLVKYYENAIIQLGENNLEIEEITTRDQEAMRSRIFEAIDNGFPVIIMSNGAWLYDLLGAKYPNGGHASVIVGYSEGTKINDFKMFINDFYLGTLLALEQNSPVFKLNDPATAAQGLGAYWISCQTFFEKTNDNEKYLYLLIVKKKNRNADGSSPIVQAFQATPTSLTLGESFAIDYTVSDNSGSGLKQVELWRKDETSDWQQIYTNSLAGETGPLSGSFTDSPAAPGKYWYGVHVIDNAGNWNDEQNANTANQPGDWGPAGVEVKGSQSITLTLYVHDGSADGPLLSGVEVTGQDAAGSSFSQTTDANGLVVITGTPGSWQFAATKTGYAANSWSQEIAETCTRHAFLLAKEFCGVEFPNGMTSFADRVMSYNPCNGVESTYSNPNNALGPPDYKGEASASYVSLGNTKNAFNCGSLVLEFVDNALVDVPGNDLYIFEVGGRVEATEVFISTDGNEWIGLGKIKGSKRGIDIHDKVSPGQEFHFVKLCDYPDGNTSSSPTPGPDIDAVGAIGGVSILP